MGKRVGGVGRLPLDAHPQGRAGLHFVVGVQKDGPGVERFGGERGSDGSTQNILGRDGGILHQLR